MYGSQADPNLDRGWLDGYKAARYDSMIKEWKKAHSTNGDPALGIGSAATKEPVGNPTGAKRTTGKPGRKATPKK